MRPWTERRHLYGNYENLVRELDRESQGDFRNFMRMGPRMFHEFAAQRDTPTYKAGHQLPKGFRTKPEAGHHAEVYGKWEQRLLLGVARPLLARPLEGGGGRGDIYMYIHLPFGSHFFCIWIKLQALVYDIHPLEEGAGKRCSECAYVTSSPFSCLSRAAFLQYGSVRKLKEY